jgi:hypothetical protein
MDSRDSPIVDIPPFPVPRMQVMSEAGRPGLPATPSDAELLGNEAAEALLWLIAARLLGATTARGLVPRTAAHRAGLDRPRFERLCQARELDVTLREICCALAGLGPACEDSGTNRP